MNWNADLFILVTQFFSLNFIFIFLKDVALNATIIWEYSHSVVIIYLNFNFRKILQIKILKENFTLPKNIPFDRILSDENLYVFHLIIFYSSSF